MPYLEDARPLFRRAFDEGWIVPAFNVCSAEMIFAVARAAEALRAPIVIQTYPADLALFPAPHVHALVRSVAEEASVPIALHLDHGVDEAMGRTCLAAGFGSVMLDGAEDDLDQLVERVRTFAPEVHAANAALEVAADGFSVAFEEATDPEAAWRLAEAGADLVAVAVGSRHGSASHLDREALRALAERVAGPLVLHGGSGVPADDLAFARSCGVAKLNVGSASYRALLQTWREAEDATSHRAVYARANEAVGAAARERIEACGAANRDRSSTLP